MARYRPGGRFEVGGGGGSGSFGALLQQRNEPRLGLFVYGDDTDPSWHLRGVEREDGEVAVRPRARFNNIDGDAYLEWILPADFANAAQDGLLLPEDLDDLEVRFAPSQNIPIPGPADAPTSSILDGNGNVIATVTYPAGTEYNGAEIRIAQAQIDAEAASLTLRGERTIGDSTAEGSTLDITFPDGAASNGIRAQVGPVRTSEPAVAASGTGQINANAVLTFTATTAGAAANGTTITFQGSPDADNYFTVFRGNVTISIRNTGISLTDLATFVNGQSSSPVTLAVSGSNVGTVYRANSSGYLSINSGSGTITLAGGSDGQALNNPDTSGTPVYDATERLLYIPSDGTVTASDALITAINAISEFDGTAARHSEGAATDVLVNQTVTAAGGVDAVAGIAGGSGSGTYNSATKIFQILTDGTLDLGTLVGTLRLQAAIPGSANLPVTVVQDGSVLGTTIVPVQTVTAAGGTVNPKPEPIFVLTFTSAHFLLSGAPVWDDNPLNMTLAELRTGLIGKGYTAWRGGRTRGAFIDAGDVIINTEGGGSADDPVSGTVGPLTEGVNAVPPGPIEFLVRGEDEGKYIEVRYHATDTLQAILNALETNNDGGAKAIAVYGTDLTAETEDPGFDYRPMYVPESENSIFGAILPQTAENTPAVLASPTRTEERERPRAADNEWDNSIGGLVRTAATGYIQSGGENAILIAFPADEGSSPNGISLINAPGNIDTASYNPGTRTLLVSTLATINAVVSAINALSNFTGVATLVDGVDGTAVLGGGDSSVGGGADTYYSQAYVISRRLTAAAAGPDSNISMAIVPADGSNAAGTMDWNATDRVLTVYVAEGGTAPTTFGAGGGLDAGIRAAGAPLAAILGDSSIQDAVPDATQFLIYPGQRIDWTGGAAATSTPADARRGLFIYGDETDPTYELRTSERTLPVEAVRSGFTYRGDTAGNALQLLFGDPDRDDHRFQDATIVALPETANAFRITHTEVDDWRAVAAQAETPDGDVIFRARTPGAAGNSLRVEALAGTPAVVGAAASLMIEGRQSGSDADAILVTFPEGAAGNGWSVDPRPARTIDAVAATAQDGPAPNAQILFTSKNPGTDDNGYEIRFAANSTDNNSVFIDSNGAFVRVDVASGGATVNQIVALLNLSSAAKVTLAASGPNVGVTFGVNLWTAIGTVTLANGADSYTETQGTAEVDTANKILYISLRNNTNATTFVGFINAASSFPGTAAVISGQGSRQIRRGDGASPASAGGVDAAPRSALSAEASTRNGITTLTIRGLLASVDRISDLRAIVPSTSLRVPVFLVITPTGGSDSDFVVVATSANPGERVFLVSLANGADASARPTTPTVTFTDNGIDRNDYTVRYIGASFPEGERTTLAELKAVWQNLLGTAGPNSASLIEFVETGSTFDHLDTDAIPTAFGGGVNEIPGTPIEFIYRGEDDGKNIEVRYHRDRDTFEDLQLASLDPVRNPDEVKVIVIAGTLLGAKPPIPPIDPIPMVPGGGTQETRTELSVQDDGTVVGDPASTLNFTGAGVTVTGSGDTKTIDIPGGGGGTEGLSTVATDATIAGDGSSANPLSVVDPYTQDKVDARVAAGVANWAEQGNTDTIPDGKIPSGIARDTEVTAAIAAGVIDEAQAGNTDPFADSKIPSNIARDSEIPDVIDTLTAALANNILTLTAGRTGSAADIVATLDISSLEEWIGPWSQIASGTAIRAGERTIHDGRLYTALRDHNRGGSGPDSDSTNWALNDNWAGAYDGTKYYQEGSFVTRVNAVWVNDANVVPSDPAPDATANTKWKRLGDNADAFTGVTRNGAEITFTRESGTNPVTIAQSQVEAGELTHRVVGAADYAPTTQNQYVSEDSGETPIARSSIADSDLLAITVGGVSNIGSDLRVFPASLIAASASVGDTSDAANRVTLRGPTLTDLYTVGLAWDSDGHLLVSSSNVADAPMPLTLYRFSKFEEEDAPPLPVSRAEAIGITANISVGSQSWANVTPYDAAPEVKFGEGGNLIITREADNRLTIKRGVYTVWFVGKVGSSTSSERISPIFQIRNNADNSEITRSDKDYDRAAPQNSSARFWFKLSTELILEQDTAINIRAGSDPDQSDASNVNRGGGSYTLYADDFEIIFVPTGGSETIFYPQTLGEATFDLTGAAQNIALEDASNNDIIAPDTGYLLATFDVPPLGLTGSTIMVRADRLRAARASTDLTSGLYTDATTHQIFYEVAAHAGGATSGNRILIEHIKTTAPVTPSGPVIDPAITEFETTSGNLSPTTGSIAGEEYGYTLAISQPSHVASARIIGFAGAGTADKVTAFATLATVTDYHDETGRITIPASTELANAGDIYTLRLEVYKTGQNAGADAPIAYHDVRIVAHAPGTAAYHWGRIAYQSGETAAQTLARITDFTGDLTTGDRLAASYAATPDNTGVWQFYFLGRADETLPVGWDSGGLHADNAFYAVQDKTIATVAYKAWILRPTYRRELADGSINYEPRT